MEYKLATSSWDEKEIQAIQKVIESDSYSMGNSVLSYEREFSEHVNSKYAVMTSSGSTANLISIAAMFFTEKNKLQRGDEIIVPAVSWSTTYFPLQQYGLKLKFVDVDIETLNYNLSDLETAIEDSTKAIMVVNLLGNPNEFSAINKLTEGKSIIVIEDNCESLGAKYDNKFTGTFGLMGTFSSFFSHHISTMEGGMVVTDDEELYHILLCLRAHGWTRNLPNNNKVCIKSNDLFNESFRFVLPGYNVRPLEMSGAIGLEQLKKLEDFVKQRRKNADYFKAVFENNNQFIIQKEIGESSWFGFSIISKSNNRSQIINELDQKNIDTRPIVTGNFANNEVLKFFDYEIHNDLDNAEIIDKQGFFVGNSHEDLTKQIDYLNKVLCQL